MNKKIVLLGLLIIGLFIAGCVPAQNDCYSDNDCSNGKCNLVTACEKMDIFCKDIQTCVKDEWQCRICSAQEKPNYYDLCCNNK